MFELDARIVSVNEENWQEEIFQSDRPVLIDLWAEWCGPCKALTPVLEELAEQAEWLKIVKIDVHQYPAIASHFGIMSIPALIVVQDGQVRGQIRGNTVAGILDKLQDCVCIPA